MQHLFTLKDFSGPLDLLLHLIEKAEMDIKNIKISEITSQYLEYMEGISQLDMDSASDFLNIAATLVLIKSRSLLPAKQVVANDEEEDPEQALIRQIREYKKFKEASSELDKVYEEAKKIFVRMPDEIIIQPKRVNIVGMDIDSLVDAFLINFNKQPEQNKNQAEVRLDEFRIKERMKYIKNQVRTQKNITFSKLLNKYSRQELIVTFMAMLELLSKGQIKATQNTNFGEILISA